MAAHEYKCNSCGICYDIDFFDLMAQTNKCPNCRKKENKITSNNSRSSSWIVQYSVCKDCDSNLIICQSPKADYWWYCSNKMCDNHDPGEQLFDMDECSFAKEAK